MTDIVEVGTLVLYHGPNKLYHGLAFVSRKISGYDSDSYVLVPFVFDEGEVVGVNSGSIDTDRQNFTTVQLPEVPVEEKPGYYCSSSHYFYRHDPSADDEWIYWSNLRAEWSRPDHITKLTPAERQKELTYLGGL